MKDYSDQPGPSTAGFDIGRRPNFPPPKPDILGPIAQEITLQTLALAHAAMTTPLRTAAMPRNAMRHHSQATLAARVERWRQTAAAAETEIRRLRAALANVCREAAPCPVTPNRQTAILRAAHAGLRSDYKPRANHVSTTT